MSFGINNILPYPLKKLAWFVFKAPQRKFGFWGTLIRDIIGVCRYYFRNLQNLKPTSLSVCVGISNRGENFKEAVIPSFIKATKVHPTLELSVFEMGGNEEDFIKSEVKKAGITNFVFERNNEKFFRARAFNHAVKQSSGELIFICDADISFNPLFIETALKVVQDGVVWFPICFALGENNDAETGKWMQWDAKGLVVCTRKDFEKIGMLNEQYTTWGNEDIDLWNRFHKMRCVVIRNKFEGLMHHWHEPNQEKIEYGKGT